MTSISELPPHAPGLKVGLFGGSFDPAHEGHRQASLLALRRLGLDRVWWLVSPGNPLKDTNALPALATRIAAAKKIAPDRRIVVTGLEAAIGARFTYQTILYLKTRCPGVHFVWIMGADNLASFERWKHWRTIAANVPIAIIDRPGSTLSATHSPAALALARYRHDESDGQVFPLAKPPALIFLHGPRSDLSSTALRGEGK
ncbi:nicotinate-nucleotide adenylyltransferase [Methylovirgula ligni]|uniref:Probable nicotinate-nucleotide adenylyltransferase n=1 Tax=Methylovirgula ligni TaxID=569860 RepID=A0A3D9YX72_9HYPH|nr:nicotinate-nucleotide adenylyltransferase [Methylovirgula ligni]REF87353.1 nicotinate-nucleotide adenylyltransferase [Methylovirgula ligni]